MRKSKRVPIDDVQGDEIKQRGFVVINGSVAYRGHEKKSGVLVSQMRLATINELQARKIEADEALKDALRDVRKDIRNGAEVEQGAFRVIRQTRYVKATGKPNRLRTTLVVR